MSTWDFVRRIFKAQPRRFSFLILMGVFVGLLEGSGIALFLPLLQLIESSSQEGAEIGRMGIAVKNLFAVFGLPMTLGTLLTLILFVVIGLQAAMYIQFVAALRMQMRFAADMRFRVYEAMFRANWSFFMKKKIGDMTNSITTEATVAGTAFALLYQLISAILVAFIYLALAFMMSWSMTVMVIFMGAIIVLILQKHIAQAKVQGQAITLANTELQSEAVEQLSGAKLIKASSIEESTIERFRLHAEAVMSSGVRLQQNGFRLKVIYELAVMVMLCASIYVSVQYFHIPIAKLIVFMFIFYRLSPRLSNAQSMRHSLGGALAAVERVDDLCAQARGAQEQSGERSFVNLNKGLSFEKVSFGYLLGHPVITDLILKIPKGQTIAVVGSSGAGKSTIIDLVMGLIVPASGEILVDGIPLNEYDLNSWRNRIGYVAQDTILFLASVKDNITWTNPDASDDEIFAAVRAANAYEFIEKLPHQFDTMIGDRGVRLSGGQRQRLALARALIRNPEILILDEATSALDAESETKIQVAVEALSQSEMTIIIVTHRLATVKNADIIYVLEDGAMVEEGSWQTLAKGKGRFRTLKHLQALD